MSKKLIDQKEPEVISSGIVKSLHPLLAPLWVDGANVIFEDGQVKKSRGTVEITSPDTSPIIGIIDALVDEKSNLVFADLDNLYRWVDGDTTVDGTGYANGSFYEAFQPLAFQDDAFQFATTRRATLWSLENWGEWVIATDGVNPPQINKMAGAGFLNLTGTPPAYADIVVRLKNYILFFNTDLGGEFFEWCNTDDVEDYVTGAAGNLPIRDMSSEIIAAERLGDVIAAYSSDDMALVQYIGPPYYFGANKTLSGIGAVSKSCVIEYAGKHYGISRSGAWVTDGNSSDYISPPLMRAWMDKNVNWGFASKIAGVLNEQRSLLEWGVPIQGGTGDNELTMCFNHTTGTWTFRSYGISAGLKQGIFNYPIIGLPDGRLMYEEVGVDFAGDALEAFVQTKPMPASEFLIWYSMDYVLAAFKDLTGTGVKIILGVSETIDGSITWWAEQTPNLSLEPLFAELGLDGKYIHLKVISRDIGDDWALSGFQIFGVPTGEQI